MVGTFIDALKQKNTPEFRAGYEDAVHRERFIKGLVEKRLAAGLSQKQVAESMGVGQPTVSQFENATDARLSTIQRYARAINADTRFFSSVSTSAELLQSKGKVPEPTSWVESSSKSAVKRSTELSRYARAV